MMMSTSMSQDVVLREFDSAKDHDQVVEICKDVYGGTDRVPRLLPSYVGCTQTFPLVLVDEFQAVLAFCCLMRLRSDNKDTAVILFEALRVAPRARGLGYGTETTKRAVAYAREVASGTQLVQLVQLVSTTIPANVSMQNIFAKSDYVCIGRSHIWPAVGLVREIRQRNTSIKKTENHPPISANGMLKMFGIPEKLSGRGQELASRWRLATNRDVVLDALRCGLEAHQRRVVPLYYSVSTAERCVDEFMTHGRNRSVWLLERESQPTAVLLIAVEGNGGHIQDHSAYLVAADLDVLQAAVAFLGTVPQLLAFHLIFEERIEKADVEQLIEVVSVSSTPFLVYQRPG